MARRRSVSVLGRGVALACALAAAVPGQAGATGPAAPVVRTERLAALNPAIGPIDLRGDRGEASLGFSLSTRIDPVSAVLHLELSNSQALQAPRSQLVVRLNDVVVAQIALKPSAPLTVADIDLPVEVLRGGSNRISFTAAQHYTNECENPGAAELWSQIDTSRSRLAITGRGVEVAPRLSDLQDLLGPGFFGGRRFTLLAPPVAGDAAGGASDAAIATGAILSEALGLRLRYQAAEIGFAEPRPAPSDDAALRLAVPDPLPGAENDPGDIVLFGTRDALAPVLGPALAQSIGAGGFIGLYPLPGDRRRLVLVVSGGTEADVARAATALGVANFPFVDAPQQTVAQLDVNPGEVFFPRNELPEGIPVRFADLGFHTTTLRGPAGFAGFDLTVPADLYTPDSAEAELSLDFAYGAGMRGDSVVNLLLNGQFVQALALPDPNGAVLRGYRIRIPARKLAPGRNTIQFETSLVPSVTGACTEQQVRNLVLALEDTSTITLPRGDRLAAQPDLHLFAATGFPYVGSAGFDVALASRDPATVAAGWTVLARLAQLAGRTLPEGHLVLGPPAEGRHAIVVGAAPDLSPALLATVPAAPLPDASFPYASAAPAYPAPSSWARNLQAMLGMAARADEAPPTPPVTRIQGQADLGRNGLLTASRAPGGDHTVTLLTASTRDGLWAAAQGMVAPAVWYQMAKDVTLWRPGSDTVYTQRVGAIYHVGSRSTLYAARYYIGEYPAAWIGTVAASVLVLAGTLRLFIVRRRQRALPGSVEGVP